MKKKKGIGINVEGPAKECTDKHCPFHGNIKVRGRTFIGEIKSKDTHKTANITWNRQHFLRKYERYERRKSNIKAHNPPCIDAAVGDKVKIVETRPVSKTKHFVIIEKLEK